jgi:diguanylate cyclase (GGDEF)-like protein/PAS domain S-box-containing protein
MLPVRVRHLGPVPAVVGVGALWSIGILALGEGTAQDLSNLGLVVVAFAAGIAALRRARRHDAAVRRTWWLLGAATCSWGAGQTVWTWYESVLGVEVPFPSLSDVGYLGMPVLAAAALLTLPFGTQTLAGRVRTLLDGLLVASSLLVCSWAAVLAPIVQNGSDDGLSQVISLAYPVSDLVLITIVVYASLRARKTGRRLPLSLPLLAAGLVALSISDSGFVYLTNSNTYFSGNPIDIGWFAGFALLLLAALRRDPQADPLDDDHTAERPLGNFLPYAAVSLALVTSSVDILRQASSGHFVFWVRTIIMALLVARQIFTLLENYGLTRTLEQRVESRTEELRTSQQRFAALVQHSSDLVTVVDRAGTVHYQSRSSARLLGYDAEAMVGRPVYELMDDDAAGELLATLQQASREPLRMQTLQSTWRHATGRECRVEVTITNLLDNPAVGGLVLNTRDVTDRVVLEQQLTHQAFTDSLTGLPNRALFKDRLQHAFSRRGTATTMAVYFLDLDGFKAVNDTLGHSAGDELLTQVADRLRGLLRPSDTIARFGGDEFAVLVDDLSTDDDGTGLAERIGEALRAPIELQSEPVHVAASIGIALPEPDSADAEQLLRNADLAMYQAKAAGTGGYAVYDPTMHAGLVERVRLESDLRKALTEQQFVLHYQPMVSMQTGLITGVEALVRWNHPERGLVPPNDFIPLAESTGLIRPLGLWVLRESCAQAVRWQQDHPEPLKLSVNVSGRQLQPELADQVADILAETGLAASLLTLEMTESVLVDHRDETLTTLTALRALGVKLAIDDFGTGYSSLSYLHRFPVDTLKIDRSFVERLSNGGDTALVSTILRLGQTMRLETVAEGIERPQELLLLRRQGCTTGQGYHFSPPVPAGRLAELLTGQEPSGTDLAAAAAGTGTPLDGPAVAVLDAPGGPLQVTAGSPILLPEE